MSASKSSPTNSHGAVPSKHRLSRRTRSVCSASSNTSMRLTAVVENSFQLSPMPSRMSVLNDRTDIQEPGSQSWWRRIGENSRRVTEIMEERDADVVKTINVAEEFDVEVLSQENEHVSVDLPESSDGESIHSIVIERRKMFVLQEDHPQKKAKLIRNKENLVNSQKSYFDKTNNMNIEQDIDVMPKRLFSAVPKPTTKPTFTAALINASTNKTVNKSSEKPAQEVQVRNLFSNRPDAKRKNNFATFLLSDSEEEIPDVRPRMFGFKKTKKNENQQISKQQRISVSQSSVRSSVSNMTDLDIDQWNHLPSSTMLEDQFQLVGTTPSKRTRLSRLSNPRQSEVATRQSNTIIKSRNSNHSLKSGEPNKSKKSNKSNRSNANVHKTKLTEENMQVDEVHNDNFTLVYDDDGEQIFEVPGKGGSKNQNQDVTQEDRIEILQDQNKIQDGTVNAKKKQDENKSEQETVGENDSEQEIVEENESEEEIEEENKSEQEIVGQNYSEKEIVEQNESEEEIEEENKSEHVFEELNDCDQEIEVENGSDQNIVEKNENDQEKQQEVLVMERKEVEEEQNQILDEMVKETENQAENKNDHEFIEENESDQESQQEKEESNEKDIKNKKQDYQTPQIKEKSYYNNPARNDGDENNIIMESVLNKSEQNNSAVHRHNKKEYQKFECREKSAQECGKIGRENASNNKDEQENINLNEIKKIDSENVGSIEDVQDTKSPEAVLHDKTMRGESFATVCRPMDSAKTNGEIVSNNKDQREYINSNENKHEDSENVGNIEDEQDAKSPEVVLHDKNNREELFDIPCHRTSINKSKTLIKDLNIRPSLVPVGESIGLTDGSLNSSAEGSGWDSHRTTRKTLRQTFGKDFTPRKSLRTLVMEKTAKRQAQNQNNEKADVSKRQLIELRVRDKCQTNFNDITSKMPLANSTEFPAFESFQDEVSLTSSAREQENSKTAIVNSAKLEECNKEKEQVEKIDAVREQDKDESIESGRETEQVEEIEQDTEEDEELEQEIERDEEIESDEAQEDEELESHTEQHQTEEIESDCEQNLSEEMDSNREYDQTKDIESDEEQQPDEEIESNRGEELADEFESYREPEETIEKSDDEISIKSGRDKSLETNVQKIIRENAEKRRKIEENVINSLKQGRKPFSLFKMPEVPKQICISKIKKPTKGKPKGSLFFTGTLPPEFLEDMKYKPPKRFTGKNAPWITKRLYKYLEEKLQPKYDYRARVRAERLVEKLYHFTKDARKRMVAPRDAVNDLKREMATLGIVNTHYDFYCFFHDFMPREIRIRVNPDILNKIPADRRVFGNILSDDEP